MDMDGMKTEGMEGKSADAAGAMRAWSKQVEASGISIRKHGQVKDSRHVRNDDDGTR